MSALVEGYAGLACDLDGVVYRGSAAVPHAVDALTRCVAGGRPVVYLTNNASRTPEAVADQLRGFGLPVDPTDVVTSAQAGARRLIDLVDGGCEVLAIGGPGVSAALREHGFVPVTDWRPSVRAVLQGYGADVTAANLAEAAYAVGAGVPWVATNTDATLPTHRGIAPGNGTLVAAVGTATGRQPIVVGKPHPPLYHLGAERVGRPASRLLAVGDRLDTDIAGAAQAGMDSVWVLTGVHGVVDLVTISPPVTPTFTVRHLDALHEAYPAVVDEEAGVLTAGVRIGVATTAGGSPALRITRADGTDARIDGHVAGAVVRGGVRLLCRLRDAGEAPETVSSLARQLDGVLATASEASAQ